MNQRFTRSSGGSPSSLGELQQLRRTSFHHSRPTNHDGTTARPVRNAVRKHRNSRLSLIIADNRLPRLPFPSTSNETSAMSNNNRHDHQPLQRRRSAVMSNYVPPIMNPRGRSNSSSDGSRLMTENYLLAAFARAGVSQFTGVCTNSYCSMFMLCPFDVSRNYAFVPNSIVSFLQTWHHIGDAFHVAQTIQPLPASTRMKTQEIHLRMKTTP